MRSYYSYYAALLLTAVAQAQEEPLPPTGLPLLDDAVEQHELCRSYENSGLQHPREMAHTGKACRDRCYYRARQRQRGKPGDERQAPSNHW